MHSTPDYSDAWLAELSESELRYWLAKPQAGKDWWAFNIKVKDRVLVLRTELGAIEVHKSLLDMPESDHQRVLDELNSRRRQALERLNRGRPE